MPSTQCAICRGAEADQELDRIQVWENGLWRLTTSLASETPGFSYLEPKCHIPHICDIDGPEAASFGEVMAHVTKALREETGLAIVYVYIFGDDVPHLHVHLAPHRKGDALNDQFIRGELIKEKLPNGFTRVVSPQFPALPRDDLTRIADGIRKRLASGHEPGS